jgi:hypothetical protein
MVLLKINIPEALAVPVSHWLNGDGLCLHIFKKENEE